MAAARTLIQMDAERSRAATLDRSQHTEMLPAQLGSILLDEAFARHMDDIGHLERWLIHFLCSLRERFTCSGPDSSSLSSGVPAAFRWRSERCR
jgi:hypothetical protein